MRRPNVLLGVYLVVCTLAVAGPGAAWAGARIEPFVLGLPFSFAWYGLWSFATFVVLVLYHRAVDGGAE
jgi:hypothetical protein